MPSKSLRWVGALALVGTVALGACSDDDDQDAIAATCEQMEAIEGPDDVTVERLDNLLEVAPDEIEDDIRLIRDRVEAEGEAAYDDEEVGAAFQRVGAFETRSASRSVMCQALRPALRRRLVPGMSLGAW